MPKGPDKIGRASKEWRLAEIDLKAARRISKSFNLSLAAGKLLAGRGLTKTKDIQAWLEPDLDRLHKPQALAGMAEAKKLVLEAVDARRPICVYGDFDVDGITSTALLYRVLESLGAQVTTVIPDRFDHGYGLHAGIIRDLAQKSIELLIAVDCGIANLAEVALAKELGLKVLIIDHHEPQPQLPDAAAIVNPRQPGCDYPFKDLAAVGLAFKLALALAADTGRADLAMDQLDLVALGTVADLAPLVGENRILVHHGIQVMQSDKRPGLAKLRQVSGLDRGPLTATQISFGLAPRLNAGGRLASAEAGLNLLLTDDPAEARKIAGRLDEQNRRRQEIEEKIAAEAVSMVEARGLNHTIVLASADWHEGVKGIVASRLVERFFRPAILFSIKDGLCVGSGRSIPGFNLVEALGRCEELLVRWGGHRAAAGLTVKEADFNRFEQSFEQVAAELLTENDLVDYLAVDLELDPEELDDRFAGELSKMAPFGRGNSTPVLALRNVYTEDHKAMGANGRHLRFLAQAGGFIGEAVAFKVEEGSPLKKPDEPLDLAVQLLRRHFNGRAELQLKVLDAKPVTGAISISGKPSIEVPPPGTGFLLPGTPPSGDLSGVRFIDRRNSDDKDQVLRDLLRAGVPSAVYVLDEHEGVELANRLTRLNGDLSADVRLICRATDDGRIPGNRLILYQAPFSGKALASLCAGDGVKKLVYLIFDQADVDRAAAAIESLCPGRQRLAEIYRLLREHGPFDVDEAAALCRRELGDKIYQPATRQLAALAVKIFAEINLVSKNEDGKLALIKDRAKTDINASKTWLYTRRLKQEFERFAGMALTAPAERLLRL